MNVVVDTNVVASAIFFGGKPKEIIDLIMKDKVYAYASKEILDEYPETIEYLLNKYSEKKPLTSLSIIQSKIEIINAHSKVNVCRDPDDNKFIECALDSSCYYIVSGDKDLLCIEKYEDIQIVTVAEFLKIFENKYAEYEKHQIKKCQHR